MTTETAAEEIEIVSVHIQKGKIKKMENLGEREREREIGDLFIAVNLAAKSLGI